MWYVSPAGLYEAEAPGAAKNLMMAPAALISCGWHLYCQEEPTVGGAV